MGKKRKLRKQLRKRELEDATALVICVGKRCCAREDSCALVEATRAYAAETHSSVQIVTVGCLDICNKGPIAATYPTMNSRSASHPSAPASCWTSSEADASSVQSRPRTSSRDAEFRASLARVRYDPVRHDLVDLGAAHPRALHVRDVLRARHRAARACRGIHDRHPQSPQRDRVRLRELRTLRRGARRARRVRRHPRAEMRETTRRARHRALSAALPVAGIASVTYASPSRARRRSRCPAVDVRRAPRDVGHLAGHAA